MERVKRYWPFIALFAIVGYFALTGIQTRRQASRDRHDIALFVASDAALRAETANSDMSLANFAQGLAIHGVTCGGSCVAEKFSAYLSAQAKAQIASARRSEQAARYWQSLAHKIDSRVAAGR